MAGDEWTLPLAAEQARVTSRTVETGRVRVDIAPVEHVEPVGLHLAETEVSVERVPVGRFVDAPPAPRTEGDVTVFPVLEERAVVTIRLYLREELRVRTASVRQAYARDVILRREQAAIARMPPRPSGTERAHETMEGNQTMSDPAIGPGADVSGLQSGSVAGTDATGSPRRGSTGERTVACLFATRTRAEEARNALISTDILDRDVQITSQETATTTTGTAGEGGGLWESLKRWFNGDDLESYYEGVNRGQTLLTVRVRSADEADRVREILERYDPVDLDAQESAWRSQGWTGRHVGWESAAMAYGSAGTRDDTLGAGTAAGPLGTGTAGDPTTGMGAAKPAAPATATSAADLSGRAAESLGREQGEQVIPVVEEKVTVGKREAGRGSVRVRTYVVETPVEEDVRLREERVHVERRPADRDVGVDAAAFQERTVEVTETREVPVVEKTARVTEEVVVRKDVSERTEHVSDKVRRTEVEVDDQTTTRGTDKPRP